MFRRHGHGSNKGERASAAASEAAAVRVWYVHDIHSDSARKGVRVRWQDGWREVAVGFFLSLGLPKIRPPVVRVWYVWHVRAMHVLLVIFGVVI